MGRPPAYIFIVRHGNRLDAADKLWHLSSPTPFDPPLTYGGWAQSRTIGQRIGNILRENDPAEPRSVPNSPAVASAPNSPAISGDAPPPAKKRRYNVVIHSSPFLRCIQTSIAIAAGLATDPRPLESSPSSPEPLSPLPQQLAVQNTTAVSSDITHPKETTPKIKKTLMRLDAFLGEWLSPGYFELITPPPSSHLMVARAKADLLRREDYSSFKYTPGHTYSHSTSQLWGGGAPLSLWASRLDENEDASTFSPRPVSPTIQNLAADSLSLPKNGGPPSPRWSGGRGGAGNGTRPNPGGYVAPVPQFALSSKTQAPVDYVAHARDACVELDYQWDSMRAPLDWGDGGEFGEEWPAMHRRFRKGLQHLVDWYTTSDDPTEPVTKLVHFKAPSSPTGGQSMDCAIEDDSMTVDSDDDDYIEESVVILVSHGAGCNALIGAITQHPVLMDVGLSSLTAAARKPGMDTAPTQVSRSAGKAGSRGGSAMGTDLLHNANGVVPLNQYYDMKLFASTEHLRSSNSSPSVSRSGSIAGVLGGTRARHSNSLSSALSGVGFGENSFAAHRSISAGSSYGTGRRPSGTATRPTWMSTITTTPRSSGSCGGITVGSGATSFSSPVTSSPLSRATRPSIGLWSPASVKSYDNDGAMDEDMEILLSFGPESVSEQQGGVKEEKKEQQKLSVPATVANGQTEKCAASLSTAVTTQNGGNIKNGASNGKQLEASASSMADFSSLGPAAIGGLWSTQPKSAVDLEPVHGMASTKRRWAGSQLSLL
ncbi:phosphoglycerate mutase family protein [Grosmannia clavigera kw1407]|uniref:Phosphoglycerate mutase family protein n=1 Tax=Grosmannia clavigera (strain kw1407 / UAMH 11150) TaxID=655863 RepID=F0X861_GROCL|nr:phosphoglycerate mutase family protein [Grosmannia clavigera kw1407]EFX05860.1 phosphoglycerate mutase family protein [Grosmannia clavigera kw1407]